MNKLQRRNLELVEALLGATEVGQLAWAYEGGGKYTTEVAGKTVIVWKGSPFDSYHVEVHEGNILHLAIESWRFERVYNQKKFEKLWNLAREPHRAVILNAISASLQRLVEGDEG